MKRNILFLVAGLLLVTMMGWGGTAVSAASSIKLRRFPTGLNQVEANSSSFSARLSADGRYIAFCSFATNLVPNDTNNVLDTFVYDSHTSDVERVSVTETGTEVYGWNNCHGVDISGDGRYVVFGSDTAELDDAAGRNLYNDIFLRDQGKGGLLQITHAYDGGPANGDSYDPDISADGRHIIFRSYASNLVPNDTNGVADVFGYDIQTRTISLISVSSTDSSVNGSGWIFANGSSVSGDGRYFVFYSSASNLVEKDTNGTLNVYVHDRDADEDGYFDEPDPSETHTELISINLNGMGGSDHSTLPSISQNGRYIIFTSYAVDLVPCDNNGTADLFVRDTHTDITEIVSLSSDGIQGTLPSIMGLISDDGRFIVMQSLAQLTSDPPSPYWMIYLRDRQIGVTTLLSLGQNGLANRESGYPTLSTNGRTVVFESFASNLVPNDTNGAFDLFLYRHKTN